MLRSDHNMKPFFIALVVTISSTGFVQAFHGEAITIRPNDNTEIIVAFDLSDPLAENQDYINSPYGFIQDVLTSAVSNEASFRDVSESIVVYLDFGPDNEVLYSASRKGNNGWQPIEQKSYGRPAGTSFFSDVVCTELLTIDCSGTIPTTALSDISTSPNIAYDQAMLDTLEELPFISIGAFPGSPMSDLNVYTEASEIEKAESTADANLEQSVEGRLPSDLRLTGALGDAIDYMVSRTTVKSIEEDLPNRDEPTVDETLDIPFEQDAALNGLRIAPGYDPKLRYITLHCTGPGVMPASTIHGYAAQGRRGKGHGYIMPNGDYITIASISDNPNQTYATKTETCLKNKAFGTMFDIELNYDCHWRPTMTSDPTEAMLDKLAEIIVWIHKEVGPLGIISHTYVDMGLRDGHTDPQARSGFDWQGLYDRIESKGGNLANIMRVDPKFAQNYPISLTDRAHTFPPVISGIIPSGPDECRQHAGD